MSQWQPPQYDDPWGERPLPPPAFPSQPWRPAPGPAPVRPPARRLPPFPGHLTRFPWQLVPRQRRRKGRGHSLGYYIYLGRHPVAVMIAGMCMALVWCLLAEWILVVAFGWLLWCVAVALGWLCALPLAALRG